MKVQCSLVIPLFNENKNIPYIIDNARKFIQLGHELVLVNNGSKDDTKKTLEKIELNKNIKILHIKDNKGFGYGVFKGLQICNNSVIAYTHGDLQCDINDVLIGLEEISTNYFLIKGKRVGRKKSDILFTKLMTIFCIFLFKKKLKDIHAQPNIFSRDLLKYFKNPPNDFSLDTYIYLLSKNHSLEIKRFETNFKNRIHEKGSNDFFYQKISTSFKEIISLIKLKRNHDIYY